MSTTIKIMKGIQKDFFTIVKLDWIILDLTGYTATFNMISKGGTIKINDAVAEITNPTAWEIKYEPTVEDVDTEGIYNAYFVLKVGWVSKLAAPTESFLAEIVTNFK